MKGCALRDIAVLYRAHYVTRSLEMALIQAKIPYAVYSGVRFFGRREVKPQGGQGCAMLPENGRIPGRHVLPARRQHATAKHRTA